MHIKHFHNEECILSQGKPSFLLCNEMMLHHNYSCLLITSREIIFQYNITLSNVVTIVVLLVVTVLMIEMVIS